MSGAAGEECFQNKCFTHNNIISDLLHGGSFMQLQLGVTFNTSKDNNE